MRSGRYPDAITFRIVEFVFVFNDSMSDLRRTSLSLPEATVFLLPQSLWAERRSPLSLTVSVSVSSIFFLSTFFYTLSSILFLIYFLYHFFHHPFILFIYILFFPIIDSGKSFCSGVINSDMNDYK